MSEGYMSQTQFPDWPRRAAYPRHKRSSSKYKQVWKSTPSNKPRSVFTLRWLRQQLELDDTECLSAWLWCLSIVLNPSYIARSFFPANLFRAAGLKSIGSRKATISPQGWKRKGESSECSTTEIFVAGKRQSFRSLSNWMLQVDPNSDEALDLRRIENIGCLNQPSCTLMLVLKTIDFTKLEFTYSLMKKAALSSVHLPTICSRFRC